MPRFDSADKGYGDDNKGGGYFKMEEGENKVRIVSSGFEMVASHYNPVSKTYITCVGEKNGCNILSEGEIIRKLKNQETGEMEEVKSTAMIHKPGKKYMVWLIDRKDGQIKLGKFTWPVIAALKDLKKSEDYAYEDYPDFDIIVKKTKNGPLTMNVEYSVIPRAQKTPLTEKELEEVAKLTPLETIVERMKNKVMKTSDSVKEVNTVTEKAPSVLVEDEDEIKMEDIPF